MTAQWSLYNELERERDYLRHQLACADAQVVQANVDAEEVVTALRARLAEVEEERDDAIERVIDLEQDMEGWKRSQRDTELRQHDAEARADRLAAALRNVIRVIWESDYTMTETDAALAEARAALGGTTDE